MRINLPDTSVSRAFTLIFALIFACETNKMLTIKNREMNSLFLTAVVNKYICINIIHNFTSIFTLNGILICTLVIAAFPFRFWVSWIKENIPVSISPGICPALPVNSSAFFQIFFHQ